MAYYRIFPIISSIDRNPDWKKLNYHIKECHKYLTEEETFFTKYYGEKQDRCKYCDSEEHEEEILTNLTIVLRQILISHQLSG